MKKEQIIEACSDELNRIFILSSVELCNDYYNYAHYESIEILNGITLKGEYKITLRFSNSTFAVLTAGNALHGKQLIRAADPFDEVTIMDKKVIELSAYCED